MKLTTKQVEAKMTEAWGRQAHVVPYRLAGNRYSYLVTDHREHWLPLLKSWVGGRQVFEPVGDRWSGPVPEPEPEPEPMTWSEAVLAASQLAQAHFVERRNRLALRRLPRGMVIAEARQWTLLGDELDTWLIPSQSTGGVVYEVNGRCTCPDYLHNGVPGGWCKHRLARALAKRAEEILQNENGAGGGDSTPAPAPQEGAHEDLHSTTDPGNGQAQRIDLVVAYEADEARVLPRINGTGELVTFKADGQEQEPPVPTLRELYRWLLDQGYVPATFQWLGWEGGLRQRLQAYTRKVADDRDTALPVQHSRGRAKLFKE
jgi:hypothetical protein